MHSLAHIMLEPPAIPSTWTYTALEFIMMRNIFRASSCPPVSNPSALASSSPPSSHASVSAQRDTELDNLRTKLDWYQTLFSQLNADAMKHEADLSQLQALCASQAQQINAQQSQLSYAQSDKQRLELRVAQLQDHLRAQTQAHEHDFKLMREHVGRKRDRTEKKWTPNSSPEVLYAKPKPPTQNQQLREAIAYTEALASSGQVHRKGMEVELHHLSALCQLANAQEEVIAKLQVGNAQLVAGKTIADESSGGLPPSNSQLPRKRSPQGKHREIGAREAYAWFFEDRIG